MKDVVRTAIQEKLSEAFALDQDLWKLPVFAKVKLEDDSVVGVEEAVRELQRSSPKLFKNWADISEGEFKKREAALFKDLQKPQPRPPGEHWRKIDAARLTDAELRALGRSFGPNAHPGDAGILKSALARQISEDNLTQGATAK